MKRFILSLSAAPLVLLVPTAAYAQELCPGPFANLCKIKPDKLGGVIGPAVVFFMVIAILVCIVFLIWGGISWMTSGGDQQKVQKARNTLIAALVGLIIAVSAFFIVGMVLGVFGVGLSTLQLPKLVPK